MCHSSAMSLPGERFAFLEAEGKGCNTACQNTNTDFIIPASVLTIKGKERLIGWFPAEKKSLFPSVAKLFPLLHQSLHCLFALCQHKCSLNRLEDFCKREIA